MTLKLDHRKTNYQQTLEFHQSYCSERCIWIHASRLFPLAAVEGTAVSPLLTRAHPVIAGGYPEAVCVQKHACQLWRAKRCFLPLLLPMPTGGNGGDHKQAPSFGTIMLFAPSWLGLPRTSDTLHLCFSPNSATLARPHLMCALSPCVKHHLPRIIDLSEPKCVKSGENDSVLLLI